MERSTRKKLLDSKKAQLAETIDADAIAKELVLKDVINEGIRDLILKLKTNKEKTNKLVDALKITKVKKFELFCNVLSEQGHEKLAQELMPKEKDRDNEGRRKNRTPSAGDAKLNSSVSGSYVDVFKTCRSCFISDVSADPESLIRKLEAGNGVTLTSATKRQLELESHAEAKAEILFDAILPQVNEYGPFFDLVQLLRDPFQHLSNSLWEQLKNIVVPPKSGKRKKHSAGSFHSSVPSSSGSCRGSPSNTRNGASNDVMKSLTNLQSDLTESQSDSLKQSLQLEKCIQTTAEANSAIKKLKEQLALAEDDRDVATSQADMARQQATEARQQLEVGLTEAEGERKRLDDQHRKWEGQMRRRMAMLEQKETYLASKEVEIKRREEEGRQRIQLTRRQQESLEMKGRDMAYRGDRQERRSAEHYVREDRIKERESNIENKESQLAEKEDEVTKKEGALKKKEIDLRRKEIETVRLEEQIKTMQVAQRKVAAQLKQREQNVARAEEDLTIIGEGLEQREKKLKEKDAKLKQKDLQIQEASKELEEQQNQVDKKERDVQEMAQEQREWEIALETKAEEMGDASTEYEKREEILRQKEDDLMFKKKEMDSLQDVLDCRLQAQERMERALRMIEVEQIRRDKELLNREAEHFHSLPNRDKMTEMEDRLEELEKKDGELQKREELLSWIEVEQQRREVELQKEELRTEKALRQKQELGEHPDEADFDMDDDQRTELESVPLSENQDNEQTAHGFEIALKGARYPRQSRKDFFDVKAAGLQTVGDFKNVLEAEEGIPASWQKLYMNGQLLEDNSPIPSTDNGGPKPKFEMRLATPAMNQRNLFKLKVKSCHGPTHTIDFSSEDTVALAKCRIYKYTGIPPHQQQLSYKEVLLENHASLQLYSIRKNATLDLRLRFPVVAKLSETEELVITADEINTTANIKATIFERTKIPLDHIKISYKNKQLEDYRTLSHYNIDEGAILQVTCPVVVQLLPAGTDINVDVEPGMTVTHLKPLLARKKNLPIEKMYLVCGDQVLADDQDVIELLRANKDITMHVGNVLVMSSSGQLTQESAENKADNSHLDQALDLSVSSLNLKQPQSTR
ncbi:uncharacterized protein LOC117297546 [Asterias rubens]|uniref:uncharacterized protein LOC117297546 n=1 Tax=Asterias rubens TaxID=7604 RepID=UPI001455D4F0|nr:uncharacterized protein LOC117297546 [Asterias rubens]